MRSGGEKEAEKCYLADEGKAPRKKNETPAELRALVFKDRGLLCDPTHHERR